MARITRKIAWKREIASQKALAMTGSLRKLLIQNSVTLYLRATAFRLFYPLIFANLHELHADWRVLDQKY